MNPSETYDPEASSHSTTSNLHRLVKGQAAVHHPWRHRSCPCRGCRNRNSRRAQTGTLGQRYILSPENSYTQIAKVVREAVGNVQGSRSPKLAGPLASRSRKNLRLPLGLNPGLIPYATRYWFMDSQKARHQLGWRPRSGIETIKATIIKNPLP